MKNIFLLFLFILIFVSCDKIKTPNQRPPAVYHCIDTNTQIVSTNANVVNSRKVLLEEYTGHTCYNCPPAAVTMDDILDQKGFRVIPITNHVTKNFGRPVTDTNYREDFRNPTSDIWDGKTFGVSNNGLPKGMVNRQQPWLQAPSAWSGLVTQNLAKAQTAKLEMTSYYNPENNYLTVKIKTSFLTAWPNSVNLMILLTQDSIISDQTESPPLAGTTTDVNDPSRRLNYRFNHVVIGSVNDPQGGSGQLVKKGPIVSGDTATLVNSCFLVKKCFYPNTAFPVVNKRVSAVCLNDKFVNCVAFVYDALTQEVLQAELIKINP